MGGDTHLEGCQEILDEYRDRQKAIETAKKARLGYADVGIGLSKEGVVSGSDTSTHSTKDKHK